MQATIYKVTQMISEAKHEDWLNNLKEQLRVVKENEPHIAVVAKEFGILKYNVERMDNNYALK
jgi:hypothetical protein